jgi:hypothetical protein
VIIFSEAPFEHRQVPSTMECPNDSSKMNVFEGTNCLICPVCQELRWLV